MTVPVAIACMPVRPPFHACVAYALLTKTITIYCVWCVYACAPVCVLCSETESLIYIYIYISGELVFCSNTWTSTRGQPMRRSKMSNTFKKVAQCGPLHIHKKIKAPLLKQYEIAHRSDNYGAVCTRTAMNQGIHTLRNRGSIYV